MFRKSARIDVTIDEPNDFQESKDARGVYTVNIKLVSGKSLSLT